MNHNLYAIWDNKAEELVGGGNAVYAFKHDAAAVRFFTDVAANPDSVVHKHPEDYDLFTFGSMNGRELVAEPSRTIITGAAWAAAQNGARQ